MGRVGQVLVIFLRKTQADINCEVFQIKTENVAIQ